MSGLLAVPFLATVIALQDTASRPHSTGAVDRPAATHVEKLLESLFPMIVKVHGASGVSTIQGYMSGCLVSPKGHVLTIDHVMLQPAQTRVVLDDGTVCEATIVRRDEKLGVAMLQRAPSVPLQTSRGTCSRMPVKLPAQSNVERRVPATNC